MCIFTGRCAWRPDTQTQINAGHGHGRTVYYETVINKSESVWSTTVNVSLSRVRLHCVLRIQVAVEFFYECLNSHDRCGAHPGSDSTLQPRADFFPPLASGEKETRSSWASGFTAAAPRSLSVCPPLKRLHCSWESRAREGAKESHEARRRGRGC